MNKEEIYTKAERNYQAKIATGKYDHYDDKMRWKLLDECIEFAESEAYYDNLHNSVSAHC